MDKEVLINDLMDFFRNYKRLAQKRVVKQNLSMTHLIALRFLLNHGASSMGDIAECLNLTHGAVTGVVDRLEGRDFVERIYPAEDRRMVKVKLTEAGEAVLTEIFDSSRGDLENVLQFLNETEQAEVARAFALLSGAFKQYENSIERTSHAGK